MYLPKLIVLLATIFPQGINIAATFDPKFAYNSASITARDTRAAGVQWFVKIGKNEKMYIYLLVTQLGFSHQF
jgi:hypothetical protein